MNSQIWTCEEHSGGVVVAFTYRDDQPGYGTECPFCFAERHAAEQNSALINSLQKLVSGIDKWNEAVRKVVDVPEGIWPELEEARALLNKFPQFPQ